MIKQEQSTQQSDLHLLTFPFALTERPEGGLPTVILNEVARSEGKSVVTFTKDKEAQNWKGVRIEPAINSEMPGELFRLWFGTGYWPILHPRAHTEGVVPADTLQAMYPEELTGPLLKEIETEMKSASKIPEIGTHEFLIRYVDRYAPKLQVQRDFNQAFDNLFERDWKELALKPERLLFNIQDYFFDYSVLNHAQSLQERGAFVSWHLHTTIPAIPEGSTEVPQILHTMLKAVSNCDLVLTHNEVYNERLRLMLDLMNLSTPELRTFELGINTEVIDREESVVTAENYKSHIKKPKDLSERQKRMIDENFRCEREGIKHQFAIMDRVDPGKGPDVVLKASDQFLDGLRESGFSYDEILGQVRIFGLLGQFPSEDYQLNNMKSLYAKHVLDTIHKLEKKWPGVFFLAEGIGGEHRNLLYPIMRGKTILTGGTEEGLWQVGMENSYVNRDRPVGLISGNGNGFAMAAKEGGYLDCGIFLESGDIDGFASAMRLIMERQKTAPDKLVQDTREINKVTLGRKASMLINRNGS